MRRVLVLLLCALAGCQTAPPVPEPLVPKPTTTIRLFGHEIPAEAAVVQAEVLQHVSAGQPAETARAQMEACGFHCLYGGTFDKMPAIYHPVRTLPELLGGRNEKKDRLFHSLVCRIDRSEIGNWGGRYFEVKVLLPYDENGLVSAVEVPRLWSRVSRCTAFFARHPELKEPVGLPVEQARALMQAQQFVCTDVAPPSSARDRRPYLACCAYHETPLGGNIIRVRLIHDQTRTVRDVEVVQKPGDFDELLCMLPNQSDTVGEGVFKGLVFPFRLYAALVVDGLIGWIAVNGR
jgi:hypothetical protein